ncbi:hypothetical protein P152DRAFT_463798 [Eremomyces bilateralis CBS 781.70]|uniref:Biogenesis of lysosome-related organelles complex 1 subunit KXD1 n=1 Tax=Eremomyces bilateralis CBS 781.70 TaxID=1392243 RepID=A0A6G1GDF3_9PEZI|nr:uncharacterized protein P152DRAFT_463798 [Eremomyces bilateralis CBS 781.70]KAF1816135.1 hypothetical protein P152DRAFT_463798 [Eremomyces bilateralis CBS 781.70]
MTSTQQYAYYSPTQSAPVSMPQKPGQYPASAYPYYQNPYQRLSASPPEVADSSTTSGVASYSTTSSNYAGSVSEYDTSSSGGSASSVDLLDYMGGRVQAAYDPMPMDKSLVQQAQTSGKLNAKTQELLRLQALARSRLASVQAGFNEGMKTAKDVQQDLEWTQKRVASINQRAARKYPAEYQMASERYPAPVSDY